MAPAMSRSVPLSALQVFMEVCKQGSMKLAADRLSVTPGAVSQQVKSLEERMGMPLFSRAHRRLELTPPGERLKAQLAASFAAIETVWGDYECSRRRATRLSINTTAAFASAWLIPRLGHFLARWPTIDVDVSSSPDEPDLHRTGIDVAIRERPSNYPGHQSQPLWTLATLAIAAPELLRGARRIETPADCKAFFMAAVAQGIRPRRQPLAAWQQLCRRPFADQRGDCRPRPGAGQRAACASLCRRGKGGGRARGAREAHTPLLSDQRPSRDRQLENPYVRELASERNSGGQRRRSAIAAGPRWRRAATHAS
jgi:DNA-binding transcriptional LysR family regulator